MEQHQPTACATERLVSFTRELAFNVMAPLDSTSAFFHPSMEQQQATACATEQPLRSARELLLIAGGGRPSLKSTREDEVQSWCTR